MRGGGVSATGTPGTETKTGNQEKPKISEHHGEMPTSQSGLAKRQTRGTDVLIYIGRALPKGKKKKRKEKFTSAYALAGAFLEVNSAEKNFFSKECFKRLPFAPLYRPRG